MTIATQKDKRDYYSEQDKPKKQVEIMSNFILTIITILAVTLTAIVYTMSNSIEIKALITLMDLPIILLIANELNQKH
tara:strand:- start:113 stop:346 length:234 start_codon:yes stop_codon:yes gene_type:complete